MRRTLAITLLIAFGLPLLAPLLAATTGPEVDLAACCRSRGTHHCAMRHSSLAVEAAPAFQSLPCPNYPAAGIPVRLATASSFVAPDLSTEIRSERASLLSIRHRVSGHSTPSANLKRGPPADLA